MSRVFSTGSKGILPMHISIFSESLIIREGHFSSCWSYRGMGQRVCCDSLMNVKQGDKNLKLNQRFKQYLISVLASLRCSMDRISLIMLYQFQQMKHGYLVGWSNLKPVWYIWHSHGSPVSCTDGPDCFQYCGKHLSRQVCPNFHACWKTLFDAICP